MINSLNQWIRRAPAYTQTGYSADNPGLVFWYAGFANEGPKVAHGQNIIRAIRSSEINGNQPVAKNISFFAHRYALRSRKETTKDKLTYHTACFIE